MAGFLFWSVTHHMLTTIHEYTYHLRFIPEGVAEASQIFLRDVLPKLLNYDEYYRRDR
jgi:hypothetical protein